MLEIITRILSVAVTIFLVRYLYALVEKVKKNLKNTARINHIIYNVIYFLVFCFLSVMLIYATINLIVFFAIGECKMV